jgi:60 kDa SS-A/Ro ribonucleoprotein
MQYTDHYSKKSTPQTEVIPGREADMVPNSAGGVSFALDAMAQFDRFLILGTEGGTYYTSERKLTREQATNADNLFKDEATGIAAVARIVAVSLEGRAPKNTPALFALALACASPHLKVRQAAFAALPRVARTGTHLFEFCEFVKHMRGWGAGLRAALGHWYTDHHNLELQLVKYRQRNGWTHRDVLRVAHPKIDDANIRWAVRGEREGAGPLIHAFEVAQHPEATVRDVVKLIHDFNLPREAIPTAMLNELDIWDALLFSGMPLNALIRNLGNMSKVGLLKPLSNAEQYVIERLNDAGDIAKARIHPLNVLIGQRTYASGHSLRGKGAWTPSRSVVAALEDVFYESFKHVEPANKRFYLGLDVSGSMSFQNIAGLPITCAEGAAVMAMVTARTEPQTHIMGFADGIRDLGITAKDSLREVLRRTENLTFGGTDCALPMMDALKQGLSVDTFVVYTDNETWAGRVHPVQALNDYRKATGIPAKLVVVGMEANPFTIADPLDIGTLDIVGFDSATPQVITNFAKG